MESIDVRKKMFKDWLDTLGYSIDSLQKLPQAASFRQYYRLQCKEMSYILMDAPPGQESTKAFIAIGNALRLLGLSTPQIIAQNEELGFLLLTDFGDETFLKILTPQNVDQYYEQALQALAILQDCRSVEGYNVPLFSREWLQNEWKWHKEWFLGRLLHLQLDGYEKALDACYVQIVESALEQPQVFMHRDYHSANLMRLSNGGIGILDFQDAFIGPVTYDLVSLVRDCYIAWPEESVKRWVLNYQTKLKSLGILPYLDEDTFYRWFDYMSLERHIKALFTFARKHVRDRAPHYLNHVPRTLSYLIDVSGKYPSLEPLHLFYRDIVQKAFANRMNQELVIA